MPGFMLHVGATVQCPHGGQITFISSNSRVLVGGLPVATLSDTTLVAGCAFTVPPGKPQPCTQAQWMSGSTRVLVIGQPALVLSSVGLSLSADMIPAGPPIVAATQTRVGAT